jgi:quercetin dioxygenase-like cupin family protein
MEFLETLLQQFKKEGFVSVYDWSDPAGTVYPEHGHKGKVALFVTEGSIAFNFEGVLKELTAGDRFDMPIGALHKAVVGPEGWSVVVGEEIEGDS